MDFHELKSLVEAVIFAAQEPVTLNGLHLVFGEAGIERPVLAQAVEQLREEYQQTTHGFELREVAGGYQFRTKPGATTWIGRLNQPKPVRLSQAALETLAIVAYQQPTTRPEIEQIRGVDCGGVLKTLLERNLIRIVGKREEPGSPLTYGTTKEFLSLFSLEGLSALPTLRDYHELMQTTQTGEVAPAPETAGADAPVAPIDPEQQVAMARTDQTVIDELEQQIRSLRHLERRIFPTPLPDGEAGETAAPLPVATEASLPTEDVPSQS